MKLTQHINQGKLIYLSNGSDHISISENEHFRWLAFEDTIQSVMHKRCPERLTLPHHYAVLIPLLFFKPTTIAELGLGGGNLSRFLTSLHADITVQSIELSPCVIHCFSQYFNPNNQAVLIEHSTAMTWLEAQQAQSSASMDWLICDVYQHHVNDFQERVNLLTALIDNLVSDACLTINLPDVNDEEMKLCITILQQLQSSHQIIYFYIPRYLNIVIHLLPNHWPINSVKKQNKNSYLSKAMYSRWKKLFSQHLSAPNRSN